MQFNIALTEVTNSIQNTLLDQIPQDIHRINVFENWHDLVTEAKFDDHLQSLNVQGLKGKLFKNIRKHQLSLIEDSDDDAFEIPLAAIEEEHVSLAALDEKNE